MKIKVEACWNGGNQHYFRVILPFNQGRECFATDDGKWNRELASNVLSYFEREFKIMRRNIRFDIS